MTENLDTGLALRTDTAVDFVRAFEHRKDLVRRGFALLEEAGLRLAENDCFDRPERTVERLEREAWWGVAARFELARIMSVVEHRKFRDQLEKGELPPLTVDNVLAFVQGLRAQIPDMHRQAVIEVFDWLRPHEWDSAHKLKTNTEIEIGKRVILSHIVEPSWGGGLHVRYGNGYVSDPSLRLLALERVLRALDGRGMVGSDTWSDLQKAIDGKGPDGERLNARPVGETDLFRYRACKNGNLHLEFKRLDLLARFNQIAGGATLKPAHGVTKSQRNRAPRPAPDARSGVERTAKDLSFFETPSALCRRLVEMADIRPGDCVLEPSAGNGALAKAVLAACPEAAVDCIEIHPDRVHELEVAGFSPREGDFLAMEPDAEDAKYEAVVMNAPFAGRADVLHMCHALRFLAPGGAFVAVASAGVMFRSDAAAREFREDVAALGGSIAELPDGSFAESGTQVRTCVVHIPRRAR